VSDASLVRRVRAGEEAAFSEFFSLYFPRLYRFAIARLDGNEDASEEVVQRTLIRAIDRLHTFRGDAALLTWLCTLCRHEIAEWIDRAWRDRAVSLSDEQERSRLAVDRLAAGDTDDPDNALHPGRFQPERAIHADVSLRHQLTAAVRWEATLYQRREQGILDRGDGRLTGSARGFELILERRSTSGVSGWTAYTYGRARHTDVERLETFWADFDQRPRGGGVRHVSLAGRDHHRRDAADWHRRADPRLPVVPRQRSVRRRATKRGTPFHLFAVRRAS
jgi:RNA polymerase sigma factor (sigma-70 family)